MTEDKPTVGQFVKSILDAARRRVAKSRNSAGYRTMYAETARAVVAEYPELTAAQKSVVFSSLKHDAEMSKIRTQSDHTGGLSAAARILGISRN